MKTDLTKDEYLAAKRGQLVRMEGQLTELLVILNKLKADGHVVGKAHRTQNVALLENLDSTAASIQTLSVLAVKRVESTMSLISKMKLELFFEHE